MSRSFKLFVFLGAIVALLLVGFMAIPSDRTLIGSEFCRRGKVPEIRVMVDERCEYRNIGFPQCLDLDKERLAFDIGECSGYNTCYAKNGLKCVVLANGHCGFKFSFSTYVCLYGYHFRDLLIKFKTSLY